MPKALYKQDLNKASIRAIKPRDKTYLTWDATTRGLALSIQPNGHRSYKFIYSFHGRARWFTIGDADALGVAEARKKARALRVQIDNGVDPQSAKMASRAAGTFAELADRYRDEYARKNNKSWPQADALVNRFLLPKWRTRSPTSITRADVRHLIGSIKAPILANQVLASAGAIFSWGVKQEVVQLNPCVGIERNKVTNRSRVLSDSELPFFWQAFGDAGLAGVALKLILLSGQRPGEVARMRREHLKDGWWELPGAPIPTLGWLGTKNGENHRVWLPAPAQELLPPPPHSEGFVFAGTRSSAIKPLDTVMRAICGTLAVSDKVTPHDLRRTHGTTITGLGFGRDAMNRIQNHREGGIADVYDRHGYAEETRRVMEAVAAQIISLVEGRSADNKVVPLR
jgi:integrase